MLHATGRVLPKSRECSQADAQHGAPSQDANLWDVSSGGPTIVFTQSGARADFQVWLLISDVVRNLTC
jgi:hypothetical protein